MDLSALLTAPIILVAAVLVVVSAWIGFAVGKSREVARKEAALADAEMTRKISLKELRAHHERKLDALVMANAEQIDQTKKGHENEIERLNNEHAELIRRLNDSNNATLNALKKDQEQQVAELKQRHTAEMEQLHKDHADATESRAAEHRHMVDMLTTEHQVQVQQMGDAYVRLEGDRDLLVQRVAELEQSVANLNHRIKESRFNNMLSVSKSGEKLIRVVRSMQELATELDETSRAVTDGEYSFFAEIKDMRDREAVLRLAGEAPPGGAPETGRSEVETRPTAGGMNTTAPPEETPEQMVPAPEANQVPVSDEDEVEGPGPVATGTENEAPTEGQTNEVGTTKAT